MTVTLIHGDCLEKLAELPSGSVQAVVTSPPYWQQRRYTDSPNEIGQERTYQEYVEAVAAVLDRAWRVLRDDGTLWLNIGDAFANDTKWGGMSGGKNYTSAGGNYGGQRNKRMTGLPPKSLIGLPWRVAFALQDQGWILRTEIVWEKTNGMPEHVTDRPTRTHEYIFLFSKQPCYFYDAAAVAEPATMRPQRRLTTQESRHSQHAIDAWKHPRILRDEPGFDGDGTRNCRTVWPIATQVSGVEHYATFPEELVRRCLLAGTSPQVCETCGAPWVRVVESTGHKNGREASRVPRNGNTKTDSTGWAPTKRATDRRQSACGCAVNMGTGRSVVLDMFSGSGTTGKVAESLGRDSILIDLNPAYIEMSRERTSSVQLEMVALTE